jgi:Domain of Unknown Function (DUF1521)
MNDISLQLGANAGLGFSPDASPFLNSYQGWRQWDPPPPIANQRQAMHDVEEASQASDPAVAQQLLEQALALLQSGGGTGATPQPMATATPQPFTTPTPAPASDTPVAATTSADSSDPASDDPGLTVNGNSVNTGEYTITASTNDDGSLTITNNQTGQSTEIWGDPHIKVNGQDTADFQQDDLNIQLQDGTVVHIQPTATNSDGVAHIAEVSITQGNQAVTMAGTGSNGFADGVTTSGVLNGDAAYQTSLYNTPTATDITLGADGNLYYNNANGSMGAEITAPSGGGETDLDGAGGGLVGDPATDASDPASSTSTQQVMQQLLAVLAQHQQSFYMITMMQTLEQMMSQSRSQTQQA